MQQAEIRKRRGQVCQQVNSLPILVTDADKRCTLVHGSNVAQLMSLIQQFGTPNGDLLHRVLVAAIEELAGLRGRPLTREEQAALTQLVKANLLAAAEHGERDPDRLRAFAIEGIRFGGLLH
jgi:hypothetical protein